MHMADALLSTATGGTMWAATAGTMVYSVNKLKKNMTESLVPLMGVMGAFIFSAQMINFSIPGTGSSGHLGGGMILAIVLGPYAAFVTIASVLTVQALFFADGGLLALGANIFNLGVFPCFVAYPLIYQRIMRNEISSGKVYAGSILSAVAALQLGAFFVVLETVFSGITELPFTTFVLFMQPIHLAIGLVEGIVTSLVVMFLRSTEPGLISTGFFTERNSGPSWKKVAGVFLVAALLTGGLLSWFASSYPDGLEWSMARVSGKEELEAGKGGIAEKLGLLQERTSILPDYNFKKAESSGEEEHSRQQSWPGVSAGTSLSGVTGMGITILIIVLLGSLMRFFMGTGKESP